MLLTRIKLCMFVLAAISARLKGLLVRLEVPSAEGKVHRICELYLLFLTEKCSLQVRKLDWDTKPVVK